MLIARRVLEVAAVAAGALTHELLAVVPLGGPFRIQAAESLSDHGVSFLFFAASCRYSRPIPAVNFTACHIIQTQITVPRSFNSKPNKTAEQSRKKRPINFINSIRRRNPLQPARPSLDPPPGSLWSVSLVLQDASQVLQSVRPGKRPGRAFCRMRSVA